MKHKILSMALVLTVLISGAAVAQNRGGQHSAPTIEQRLKRWDNNVFSKLDLKNDQQAQMNKIFTDYFNSQDSLRNSGQRPSFDDIKKIAANRDEKVKSALSADQFKKYQDLIQQQQQSMRQGMGHGQGGGRGDNYPQQ